MEENKEQETVQKDFPQNNKKKEWEISATLSGILTIIAILLIIASPFCLILAEDDPSKYGPLKSVESICFNVAVLIFIIIGIKGPKSEKTEKVATFGINAFAIIIGLCTLAFIVLIILAIAKIINSGPGVLG